MGRRFIFRRQLPRRGHLSRQEPEFSPTYAVLAILSDCCPPPEGRLPTCYAPVRHFTRGVAPSFSFDLHVLGPPLTFALSQDQTLQLNLSRRPKPPNRQLMVRSWCSLCLLETQRIFGFLPDGALRRRRFKTFVSICYSAFRDRRCERA